MWLPSQLTQDAHQAKLKDLGFELSRAAYADLRGYPLGAVAMVGGCSASFVSKLGLIVTNHHCLQGVMSSVSKEGENLLASGYIAYTQAQELPAPGLTGSVTLSSRDVTDQIVGELDPGMSESERASAVEENLAALIQNCQDAHPQLRCTVSNLYDGNRFELQKSQALNDLRLAYVPPEGIGWFGGDQDNWRWPRQTGDFAFVRAYGPDGKPLVPQQHLRIANEALESSDPVMVAGYPGRTYRYRTGAQVQLAEQHNYPGLVERFKTQIQISKDLMAEDPKLTPFLNPRIFGLSNGLINFEATLQALKRSQFADERLARDEILTQWIAASPQRQARFGSVIQEQAKLVSLEIPNFKIDQDSNLLAYATIVLSRALSIVSQAKLRSEGKVTTVDEVLAFEAEFKRRSAPEINVPGLEEREIAAILDRMSKDQPEGARRVRAMLGKGANDSLDPKEIRSALSSMYASTTLQDLESAISLFEKASLADLENSEDGFIQAGLALDAILHQIDVAKPSNGNSQRRLRRLYTQARVEFAKEQGLLVAPDANRTLRVSYGKVQGYKPLDQGFTYPPFSTGAQLLAKHTGEYPFALPEVLVDALRQRDYGRYFDPRIGDIPVNFLSTTDVTGGNSGSATMNGKGELVGLLFDGNYEGLLSNWFLEPEITRSIHVDMRFVLWVMDTVMPAHRLLKEMGIDPSKQSVSARRYRVSHASPTAVDE